VGEAALVALVALTDCEKVAGLAAFPRGCITALPLGTAGVQKTTRCASPAATLQIERALHVAREGVSSARGLSEFDEAFPAAGAKCRIPRIFENACPETLPKVESSSNITKCIQ
jgi:hypothetical protein